MMNIFVFTIMFSSFAYSCTVKDDMGQIYDLSSIIRYDMWKVKDRTSDSGLFSMYYLFNFCKDLNEKCKGKSSAAMEQLEVFGQATDTCEIMGERQYSKVTMIDEANPKKGIRLTYDNGEPCINSESPSENGHPRKVTFKLICAPTTDPNFYQSRPNPPEVTKCSMEFKIKTPAGCPTGMADNSSLHLLINILTVIVFYMGIGYFLNNRYNGKEGLEALPHWDYLRETPFLASEGIRFFMEKSNETFIYLKNMANNATNKGYSSV